MKNGQGKIIYQNGDEYIGNFQNNLKNGEGTLIKQGGNRIFKQNWVNGQLELESEIQVIEKEQLDENQQKEFIDIDKIDDAPVQRIYSNNSQINNNSSQFTSQQNTQLAILKNNIYNSQSITSIDSYKEENNFSSRIGIDLINVMENMELFNAIQPNLKQKQVKTWTVEDISQWLECIDLGQYIQTFQDNQINGESIIELTEQDLKEELQIKALGHRKILQKHIQCFQYFSKSSNFNENINKLLQQLKDNGFYKSINFQSQDPQLQQNYYKRLLSNRITPSKEILSQNNNKQLQNFKNPKLHISISNNKQEKIKSIYYQQDQINKNSIHNLQEIKSQGIEQINQDTNDDEQQQTSSDDLEKLTQEPPTKQFTKYSNNEIIKQDLNKQWVIAQLKINGINPSSIINLSEIKVEKKIGEGGFGKVFKGIFLGQDVAIKQFGNKQLKFDKNRATDFLKEVAVIKILNHPNIVLFMGVCINFNRYFIITEFLEEGSLFQYLHQDKKVIEGEQLLQIMEDIALGMAYLHFKGILHCDLKSQNVLIDFKQNVKLCDFGLSKIDQGINNKAKQKNQMVGTYNWMAPEILRGEEYTQSADVYSFGMVLWEIVYQRIPFEGLLANQIIHKVGIDNNFKMELPNSSINNTQENVFAVNIIKQCLQRDPEKRPSFKNIVQQIQNQQKQILQTKNSTILKPQKTKQSIQQQKNKKIVKHLLDFFS